MDVSAFKSRRDDLSDADIVRLVSEINENGYCCIPNYVDECDLDRMRKFVASAVERAGKEYVLFKTAAEVSGSGLDALADCPNFKSLFSRLYSTSTDRPAPPVSFYQILRCLTGRGMTEHSLRFHYDSYLVTALLPVEIPGDGRRGDLLVWPNTRKIRRTYLANLCDKVILESRLTQHFLRWLMASGHVNIRRIAMVPGNLYLFWGYRSIHTNEPCDPARVRATAVYHYADPHAGSTLKARLHR